MKKFNEWCDQMDAKLKDFEWRDLLYALFPLSIFFKRKPQQTSMGFVYETKVGKPIQFQSQKYMSNMEMLYGTDVSKGTNFALDMIQAGIKREICDEIMKSDLFEWQTEDTPMGTRVSARLFVNNFQK